MKWERPVGLGALALFLSHAALAQSSGSYLAGAADRTAYENWFASLNGEYQAGVEFWVSHRSIPKQATCFASGMAPESDWMHGCLTAQQRMNPWDAKRKADPEYRLGWNSIQSPEVQQAVRARQGMPSGGAPTPPAFPLPAAAQPQEDVGAECSQEVSLAYQRGMVPSPTVAYQVQESCIERHRQEEMQAAQALHDAELRAQAARELARRQAEQVAAEQSPDNNCRKPAFAGGLMDNFNDFDQFKSAGIKAIDIEHLTTVQWNNDTMDVICHGTFVLTNGVRLTGSMEMKPNVAGNMITQWKRDQ